MRIIVMYDLPMQDESMIRSYNQFRKKLIRLGFYQLQYSIYVKVVPNEMGYQAFLRKIQVDIPKEGNIRIIKITEKQYQSMVFLQGTSNMHEIVIGDNEVINFRSFDE